MNYYIGVDPGLKGAIAIIDETGKISVQDMPIISYEKGLTKKRNIKHKTEYDVAVLKTLFQNHFSLGDCFISLEKMQALPPGYPIQATAGLMWCMGFVEGVCAITNHKYELVKPKDWQHSFEITKDKGDTKAQSYQIASRLFPEAELKGPRGALKDGRCDALLIAEWGRRKCLGLK
jgi:hypothetical protein